MISASEPTPRSTRPARRARRAARGAAASPGGGDADRSCRSARSSPPPDPCASRSRIAGRMSTTHAANGKRKDPGLRMREGTELLDPAERVAQRSQPAPPTVSAMTRRAKETASTESARPRARRRFGATWLAIAPTPATSAPERSRRARGRRIPPREGPRAQAPGRARARARTRRAQSRRALLRARVRG